MDDIVIYLKKDKLPDDREQARRVRYHTEQYLLVNDKFYKRGISTPLLQRINDKEAKEVISEIRYGIYENHAGRQSLAYKALLQGFYWPTIKQDTADYAR